MIEKRTSKQIVQENCVISNHIVDKRNNRKEDYIEINPEKINKVWVGLESLKKEIDFDCIKFNVTSFRKIDNEKAIKYLLDIIENILCLCTSQEQKEPSSYGESAVSCEHNTGEDKKLTAYHMSSTSSPVILCNKCNDTGMIISKFHYCNCNKSSPVQNNKQEDLCQCGHCFANHEDKLIDEQFRKATKCWECTCNGFTKKCTCKIDYEEFKKSYGGKCVRCGGVI